VNERAHYLRLIPTKNLKSVFKTVPDADVFSNILEALTVVASGSSSAPVSGVEAEPAKPKPKRAIVYLKKIAASRRFDMAVMLLSKTDQQVHASAHQLCFAIAPFCSTSRAMLTPGCSRHPQQVV